MKAMPVEKGSVFVVKKPQALLNLREYWFDIRKNFSVTSDGQRFLMLKPVLNDKTPQTILVQNWFDELERLVPPR